MKITIKLITVIIVILVFTAESIENQELNYNRPRTIHDTISMIIKTPEIVYELPESYHYLVNKHSKTHHLVTITVYNATQEQCGEIPERTADGSWIDFEKLEAGKLKWCAVSRDLLYSKYPYGSKIKVYLPGRTEIYTVHDTMSPKFTSRIDLLSPDTVSLGKWEKILIKKI